MVFSDCSSEEPQQNTKNGLCNISERNESSERGRGDSVNSQNLNFLNQQVFLAQMNESTQTANSPGQQHQNDFSSLQFRSKSTYLKSPNPQALAVKKELSDIDGLLSSDDEQDQSSISLSTKIKIEEKQLDLDLLSEDNSDSTAVDPEGKSCSQQSQKSPNQLSSQTQSQS